MSKPFDDLNLTGDEIARNYTWQQIQKNQEYINTKIFDDPDNNNLIVSNQDNTLGIPQGQNNTIIGTANNVTESEDTTTISHHTNINKGKYVIKVGGGEDDSPTYSDNLNDCIEVISIGYDNSVNPNGDAGVTTGIISIGHNNTVEATKSSNTIIGSLNNVNGTGNTLIGNHLAIGSYNGSNSIIISPTTINNSTQPASNSIVFGGATNFPPTNDARIQFLNTQLLGAGGGDTFANKVSYDNTIPIKYKGNKYLIPVFLDP